MRFFFQLFILSFVSLPSFSQQSLSLKKKQDSLKVYSRSMIMAAELKDRINADSMFTKVLVRTLVMPNSFNFSYDSVQSVSILTSPDNVFRIFTWQLPVNENMVRQRGAIQMKTNDGKLKLIPLIDKSDLIVNSGDTVTGPAAWLGAVYYKILMNKAGDKTFYTLLGFDGNNLRSDKKIIEIMHFDVAGRPVFGGPYFDVPALPSAPDYRPGRIIIEYKKNAGTRLTFSEEENLILVEHLISETNEPAKKYTLVPDGDYTGFRWQNGRWIFLPKVFETTVEATPPVPKPYNEGKIIQ